MLTTLADQEHQVVWGEGFVRPLLRDRYPVSRRPSVGICAVGREGANREGGRARHAPGARLHRARFPSVCHKHSEVSSLSAGCRPARKMIYCGRVSFGPTAVRRRRAPVAFLRRLHRARWSGLTSRTLPGTEYTSIRFVEMSLF